VLGEIQKKEIYIFRMADVLTQQKYLKLTQTHPFIGLLRGFQALLIRYFINYK